MKLFIGNLPYIISESDLSQLCSGFGEVVSVKLVRDPFSGQPKGFAFVEMLNRSMGHKVMEGLNGKEYRHRELVCSEAKPQKKRGQNRR